MTIEQAPASKDALEHPVSVKDRVAKTYFEESRWCLEHAIRWVALRTIEAFASRDLDEIRSMRYGAIVRDGVATPLVSRNPAAELVDALRADKIKSIGPDHRGLPGAAWDAVLSHDFRTWPTARFSREEMLATWPVTVQTQASPSDDEHKQVIQSVGEDKGSQESDERLQERLPQREAIKTDSRRPRMSDRDVERILPSFLKQLRAEWADEERFNQITARAAAETHFGKMIDRGRFRTVYGNAGLIQPSGRPRKTPQKS